MRKMFLVAAKLLGLMQFYWALGNFLQLGWCLFGYFSAGTSAQVQAELLLSLTSVVVYFITELCMAWLLIARTAWLADRLGILDADGVAGIERQSVLAVGVKLIGVYVTVHAFPILIRTIWGTYAVWADHMPPGKWEGLIVSGIQLALGLLLTFGTERVVSIITRRERDQP